MGIPLPPPAFYHAVSLFNAGNYDDCHEVIENELWRPLAVKEEACGERQFYQGILQIGVGLHHLTRCNVKGAHALLRKGLERLCPLENALPFCQWMDISGFIQNVKTVMMSLVRKPFNQGDLNPDDFPVIRLPPLR